jgi:hypothetical protein
MAATHIMIASYNANVLGMALAIAQGNHAGIIFAVGAFIWDLLPEFPRILKLLVTSIFDLFRMGAAVASWNPASAPVKVAFAMGSILLAAAGLWVSGCLPTL